MILHLDLVGGLAGDMLCAALLDLGADLGGLRGGLEGLSLPGWSIRAERVLRGPFAASRFIVELDEAPDAPTGPEHGHDHGHSHSHDHGHSHSHSHSHSHGHSHGAPTAPAGHSRSWREIRALLTDAPLPGGARERAISVFARLAEAEGRVHGMAPEDVTFHEVGALDSIIDIVGACLALHQLGITGVTVGPVPVGSGFTRSQHGPIPLPAPATAELLRGFPIEPGPPGRELVTPTGAAFLAALATPRTGPPPMRLVAQGYGAGTRNPVDRPNVVRALLGAPVADGGGEATSVVVLETQVDDLSGEHIPPLIDALLQEGALDALAIPALMKKGRPAYLLKVLARPHTAGGISETLLRHSGSFGVRAYPTTRRVLDRWHTPVSTPYGDIRIKVGALNGEILHRSPEFEDVRAAAKAAGVPVPRVHSEAVRAAGAIPHPKAVPPPPTEDE